MSELSLTQTSQPPTRGFASRIFDSLVQTARNPNIRDRVRKSAMNIGQASLEGMGVVTRDRKTGERSISARGVATVIKEPTENSKQKLIKVAGRAASREASNLGADLIRTGVVRAFDRLLPNGESNGAPAAAAGEQSSNGMASAAPQPTEQVPAAPAGQPHS